MRRRFALDYARPAKIALCSPTEARLLHILGIRPAPPSLDKPQLKLEAKLTVTNNSVVRPRELSANELREDLKRAAVREIGDAMHAPGFSRTLTVAALAVLAPESIVHPSGRRRDLNSRSRSPDCCANRYARPRGLKPIIYTHWVCAASVAVPRPRSLIERAMVLWLSSEKIGAPEVPREPLHLRDAASRFLARSRGHASRSGQLPLRVTAL